MSDNLNESRLESAQDDGAKSAPVREQQGLLKYAVILASMVVILAGIHFARGVLGPFFLATFFAVLLTSPINWLKSKGLPSWCALTVAVVGVAIVGLGTMTVVGAQLAQFAVNIPTYRDRFNATLESYDLDIGEFIPLLKSDKAKEEGEEVEEETPEEEAYLEELRLRAEYAKDPVAGKDAAVEKETVETNKPEPVKQTAYLSDPVTPVAPVALQNELPHELAADAEPVVATPTNEAIDSDLLSGGLTPMNPPEYFSHPDAMTQHIDTTIANALAGESEPNAEKENGEAASAASDADNDYEEYLRALRERKDKVKVSAVNASSQELFRFLRGLVGELSYLGSNAFLVTLLVIFMLCETAKIPQKLVAALGKRRFTNTHIEGVIADIRNYMVIKTLMSVLVGMLVAVLCVVSNVQYPVLWGLVAFLLNYIPNIGSVAAAIPPIVLATVDHGLMVGCVDAICLAAINCFVGYGLEPRLLGDGLDLSPLIVLISLIFFGWLLGPVGMFLSPPLAVVMKIIFQSFPETKWIAALMALRPPKVAVDDEEVAEAAA